MYPLSALNRLSALQILSIDFQVENWKCDKSYPLKHEILDYLSSNSLVSLIICLFLSVHGS